jgi:UDP-glucose 4-epimerase
METTKTTILVTGGAGYIGSHVVHALCDAGHVVVILDDLSTGKREYVDPRATFVQGSICDPEIVERVFAEHAVHAVMHFAAKLLVQESVEKPIEYYKTNVGGSVEIVRAMQRHNVQRIVFSSSAAVYGTPKTVPITEEAETVPVNPYGHTKRMVEQILHDMSVKTPLRYVALRYFNATDVNTSHLIPAVMLAALGKKDGVSVFGTDYETPDGSAVRDYVHIDDLVSAHVSALEYLLGNGESTVLNVGTENGVSVLQVIEACQRVTGKTFRVTQTDRRAGDPPMLVASYQKIHDLFGWKPTKSLDDCIRSIWEEMQ